jgi:outer membrane protein assembly factor BamB
MSLRSLSAFLVASALLAAPAAADRLLVAGSDGFVMQADTRIGVFEPFGCQCAGPIVALATDGHRVYAADELGNVLVFDAKDGVLLALHTPQIGQINALAAAGGALFAGTENATVVRLDPFSGAVIGSRSTPDAVRSLVVWNGALFAAGADAAIYRAPLNEGEFVYFSCFCFFQIQDMLVYEGDLVVVDGFGTVARVDAGTGAIQTAFFVGSTNSMARRGDAPLFYAQGSGGTITLSNPETGQPLPGGFTSPIDVQAMLVTRDYRAERARGGAAPDLRQQ